ncbi:MAG: hypothetical protein M5U09_13185 [Gammaproteobacteria bacterium]|nr:hypothetical protein [Gammaproteobacteria bacterium]
MYLGRIVESGTVDEVFCAPAHPYTRALLDSIPPSTLHCVSGSDPLPGSCRAR